MMHCTRNNRKKKWLGLLFLCCLPCQVLQAEVHPSDTAVIERTTIWNDLVSSEWNNPAIYGNEFSKSYSTLQLDAVYSDSKSPFILQKGEGKLHGEARVTSYLRLSKYATVWGAASYLTGKNRKINWSSTADYDLLAPYILADSVGGDTQTEQYNFSGGYATQLGKWCVGGELVFRAEQEYCNRDPRMRSVVSDLTFKAGGTYDLKSYQIGVAVLGNIYRQSNDVDIYNELGGPTEYMMTGLGTYYQRFSGSETDIYYKGGGIGVLLSATPLDGSGLYGDAAFSNFRYRRYSDIYNSLPLTSLYSDRIKANIGWKHTTNKYSLAFFGHFDFTRKHGDEHIAGNALAGVYPVIADLTMYKNYSSNTYIGVLYGRKTSLNWNVEGRFGYLGNRCLYVYLARNVSYKHLYGELKGQAFLPVNSQLMLSGLLSAAYFGKIKSSIAIPYVDIRPSIISMLSYNDVQSKANYSVFQLQLRGDYQFKNSHYGMFIALNSGVIANSEHNHQTNINLSLGFKF